MHFKLSCENKHEFEGWFRDKAEYEKQSNNGMLVCPFCESKNVQKGLMSPAVSRSLRNDAETRTNSAEKSQGPTDPILEQAESRKKRFVEILREFKKEITKNADYVGTKFAEESKKMHYGESKKRPIYGKATENEARDLREEGIEFCAIPNLPEDNN